MDDNLQDDVEEKIQRRHEQRYEERVETGKKIAGAAGAAALWGGCLLYAMLPLTVIVVAIIIVMLAGVFRSE